MFIQAIQGKTSREADVRALTDEWVRDMAPTVDGWLGGTYGFTDDGTFVGVVRFESRDAAMANSDRPEQTAWAERMQALFDGPLEFRDSDDVTLMMDGGSDSAGFVQVIQGRVDDPARLKSRLADTTELREMRPEIIGGTLAVEPDGAFTQTIAFTDEESARRGEQLEPPEDVRTELEWAMQGATFYDLRRPWFHSPS